MIAILIVPMEYSASATICSKELKFAEHSFLTQSDFLASMPTPPPLEFALGV